MNWTILKFQLWLDLGNSNNFISIFLPFSLLLSSSLSLICTSIGFTLNEWPPQVHVSSGAVWEAVGHLRRRVLLMDICHLWQVLKFYNLALLLVRSLLWDCWCYVRSGPHAPGCYHFPIMMDAGTAGHNKPRSPLNCSCWCLNTVTKTELTQ